MCSREYLPALTLNCPRESGQILQRMKLSLSRKVKTRSRVPKLKRRALEPLYIHESGAMRGRQFIFQHFQWPIRRQKEITLNPLEFTFNFLFANYCFNTIDCRCMTLCRQP